MDAVRRLRATQPGAPRRVPAARGGGRVGPRQGRIPALGAKASEKHAAAALLTASEKAWEATLDSYKHGLATFPDVRESQRDLARARTLDQSARAEVWTQAAAFAFSTGDLARP